MCCVCCSPAGTSTQSAAPVTVQKTSVHAVHTRSKTTLQQSRHGPAPAPHLTWLITTLLRLTHFRQSHTHFSLSTSLTQSSSNMSWQSYVDDQLISTKVIKNAVIAGHDGNIWATSAGFGVSNNLQTMKVCKIRVQHKEATKK